LRVVATKDCTSRTYYRFGHRGSSKATCENYDKAKCLTLNMATDHNCVLPPSKARQEIPLAGHAPARKLLREIRTIIRSKLLTSWRKERRTKISSQRSPCISVARPLTPNAFFGEAACCLNG